MTILDKLKEYGVSEAVIVEILADCSGSDEQCIDNKIVLSLHRSDRTQT